MRIGNLELGIRNSCALALVLSIAANAQESTRTVADGVYSDAQASRGAAVYDAACASCHRADLGGASGPALREERFDRGFAGKDLKDVTAIDKVRIQRVADVMYQFGLLLARFNVTPMIGP